MTPSRGAGDICLVQTVARLGGEAGTSCRLPFPGRPGLSQSRSRRVFQIVALSTVLSRNVEEPDNISAQEKAFLFTISSHGGPVNNLRIIRLTGFSPRRHGGQMLQERIQNFRIEFLFPEAAHFS